MNNNYTLFDILNFAEWIDINCIRTGNHKWTYKGDNFKQHFSTEELYYIYIEVTTKLHSTNIYSTNSFKSKK